MTFFRYFRRRSAIYNTSQASGTVYSCGGTHVRSLAELLGVHISAVKMKMSHGVGTAFATAATPPHAR
ncbi:hypothetical protein GCM10023078_10890 [Gibbsiella greigii]